MFYLEQPVMEVRTIFT